MVSMPRSARLAVWASAWLRHECSLGDVVARVRGDDEPHDVVDLPGAGSTAGLDTALNTLRDAGVTGFWVALPVPGDPTGLGGPRELTEDAVDAREAVLAVNTGYALVPDVRTFGPPGDQGHLVTWRCQEAAEPPPAPSLAEADQALTSSLLEASSTLAKLDVASWRPEVAALLEDVRSAHIAEPLPRVFSSQAQTVAARSIRLLAVAEFALEDDGGAVNASAAESRRAALAPLERTARHGLVAACNSLDGDQVT